MCITFFLPAVYPCFPHLICWTVSPLGDPLCFVRNTLGFPVCIGLFLGFIFHPFLFFVFRSILLYHLDFRINHLCYQKHTYYCWNFNQIKSNLCRNLKFLWSNLYFFDLICISLILFLPINTYLVFGPLQFLYIVLTHIFVLFIPRWFIFFVAIVNDVYLKMSIFMLFVVCI